MSVIPSKKRQRVKDRDGRRCLMCGSTKDLTVDHIKPRARGGGNGMKNLQTLCRLCNEMKGSQPGKDYHIHDFQVTYRMRLALISTPVPKKEPHFLAKSEEIARKLVKKAYDSGKDFKRCVREYQKIIYCSGPTARKKCADILGVEL